VALLGAAALKAERRELMDSPWTWPRAAIAFASRGVSSSVTEAQPLGDATPCEASRSGRGLWPVVPRTGLAAAGAARAPSATAAATGALQYLERPRLILMLLPPKASLLLGHEEAACEHYWQRVEPSGV
jgi:hypothetical protein